MDEDSHNSWTSSHGSCHLLDSTIIWCPVGERFSTTLMTRTIHVWNTKNQRIPPSLIFSTSSCRSLIPSFLHILCRYQGYSKFIIEFESSLSRYCLSMMCNSTGLAWPNGAGALLNRIINLNLLLAKRLCIDSVINVPVETAPSGPSFESG